MARVKGITPGAARYAYRRFGTTKKAAAWLGCDPSAISYHLKGTCITRSPLQHNTNKNRTSDNLRKWDPLLEALREEYPERDPRRSRIA